MRMIRTALALAVTVVVATGALAQRPGPAPIVVSGSGSEPVRVIQGGQERIVAPATSAPMIAQSTAGDSVFDVPEPADEAAPADELAPGTDDALTEEALTEEAPEERRSWTDRPSGYQPSSRLNEGLPGAETSAFSKGYAPSSTLNERMAAQASSQMVGWPVGEVTGVVTVQQWSSRGLESRRGSR